MRTNIFKNTNKSYANRLRSLSAPAIFSILIIICMFIIYCCETLGIAHKERNLMYRLNNFGKQLSNVQISEHHQVLNNDKRLFQMNDYLLIKEQHKKYNQIRNIISSGMISQLIYENSSRY